MDLFNQPIQTQPQSSDKVTPKIVSDLLLEKIHEMLKESTVVNLPLAQTILALNRTYIALCYLSDSEQDGFVDLDEPN